MDIQENNVYTNTQTLQVCNVYYWMSQGHHIYPLCSLLLSRCLVLYVLHVQYVALDRQYLIIYMEIHC